MQTAERSTFHEKLAYGQDGEQQVRALLLGLGFTVLVDAWDYTTAHECAPTMELPNGEKVPSPDLLVAKGGKSYWIEVKRKGERSWRRNTERYEHGIDVAAWEDYLEMERQTADVPVYLAIVEDDTGEVILAPVSKLAETVRFGGYTTGGGRHRPMAYFDRDGFVSLLEFAIPGRTAVAAAMRAVVGGRLFGPTTLGAGRKQ